MIPTLPLLPWPEFTPTYIPPEPVQWREVWFHVPGAFDVCGVFECMRSHRWKAVLYTWTRIVVAKYGFYNIVEDSRQFQLCPFCGYAADRFILNWTTFAVVLTAPPRQLEPWPYVGVMPSWVNPWPHRLFPWEP